MKILQTVAPVRFRAIIILKERGVLIEIKLSLENNAYYVGTLSNIQFHRCSKLEPYQNNFLIYFVLWINPRSDYKV